VPLSRAFVFSDAFDAEAGISLGRFGDALFSCILCVCWDSIPRLVRPCSMDLFCLSAVLDNALVGRPRTQKMGFPAAIREKPRCWVALSCAGHSVSTRLGEIKQPCPRSLRVRGLVRRFFNLAFLRGKDP